jgi:hypothetical protein
VGHAHRPKYLKLIQQLVADLTTVEEDPLLDAEEEEPARTATTPPPIFLAASVSPGARSNMSISGTTAFSNLSESEAAELNNEKMLFKFPTLYNNAQDIFRVVTRPNTPNVVDKLVKIVRDIKIPGSTVSEELDENEHSFRSVQKWFRVDGDYIRGPAVMKSIFGGNLPEPDTKAWAAMEVIQTANLASFATWIASAEQDSIKTWNLLRSVDNAFPTWFLTSFLEPRTRKSTSSSAPSWKIGSSTLLRETFEFALELRTHVAVLAFLRQHDQEDFDSEQVIRDVFYSTVDDDLSEDAQLRTWGVNGLGGDDGELHPNFKQQMQERISAIRQCFYDDSQALLDGEPTDLHQLQVEFPWSKFTIDGLKWIRLRRDELLVSIKNRGDVDGIVSSIKQELSVNDSMIGESVPPRVEAPASTLIEQRGTPRANGKQKKKSSRDRSVILLTLQQLLLTLCCQSCGQPEFHEKLEGGEEAQLGNCRRRDFKFSLQGTT